MKMGAGYDSLPQFIKTAVLKSARGMQAVFKIRKLTRFLEGLAVSPEQRYLKWISVFDQDKRNALYSKEFLNTVEAYDPSQYLFNLISGSNIDDSVDRIFYTDIMSYLPEDLLVKVDIATMANSLEARSPFLDHKLMEFSAKLPSGFKVSNFNTKQILKESLKGILPNRILNRNKKGFGVPLGSWFRGELKDYLSDILLDNKALKRGYFDPKYVKQIIAEHNTAKCDHGHRLWSLLNMELWHDMFMDKTA
ncbi:MAG: asparagine synthetase B, partial [Candidatus Omnitrophica bacterium]|nr:asparagine synthetase B [Candidatus Omnitrophota bacterium]